MSAVEARNAADHEECPLGKDGPSVSAIGLKAGRVRSASSLTVVVSRPVPAIARSMSVWCLANI